MKKIKQILKNIVSTNIGWMLMGSTLIVISCLALKITYTGTFLDKLFNGMWGLGFLILASIASIALIYAWIILPISALVKWIKSQI